MRAGLLLVLLGGARAQLDNACQSAYNKAYMSSLGADGICNKQGGSLWPSEKSCKPQCQDLINKVREACRHETYDQHDFLTNTTETRSFMHKAIRALQGVAPKDCDYSMAYKHCDNKACTMAEVTGGTATSELEKLKCIATDPLSGQSEAVAVWRSCGPKCSAQFEAINTKCGACEDPTFKTFLQGAAAALVHCKIGNGHTCSVLGPVLNNACCAGPDKKAGNGDDTCNFKNGTLPIVCDDSSCMAAVQASGTTCPRNFTTNPKLLGLYEDCGGDISKIFALTPQSTQVALYCDGQHGQGRRRQLSQGADVTQAQEAATAMGSGPVSASSFAFRRVQQSPITPANPECDAAWNAVYSSMIDGVCNVNMNGVRCTRACQTQITTMLRKCHNSSFTVDVNGVNVTTAFSQRAVGILEGLGPLDCAYHLGYAQCDADICQIANMSAALQLSDTDPGQLQCAQFFMGAQYLRWAGCQSTEGGMTQPSTTVKACFDKFAKISEKCAGCTKDGIIHSTLKQMALDTADTHCTQNCSSPQMIADNVQKLCCAGADGIVGTQDDPCSPQTEKSFGDDKEDIDWHVPSTCVADTSCNSYIVNVAKSCPSTFLGKVGRGIFYSCGGDLDALVAQGRPCDQDSFAMGIAKHHSVWGSGIPAHASWGSCANDSNPQPYLKSGQSCELTCDTGWCVAGMQPRCVDGMLTLQTSTEYPMSCRPQPVVSCTLPPNGGCDSLKNCEMASVFGQNVVHCGNCPGGYQDLDGTCVDVNECLTEDGFCDAHTVCTNLDGGYQCSDCPKGQGLSGDSYRQGGA
jgi:hypothetical protein